MTNVSVQMSEKEKGMREKKRKREAGEKRRETEGSKQRKNEKKEGRERDSGRGVVTCALSYNRGSRPGICRHSRHQMTCYTTRRL